MTVLIIVVLLILAGVLYFKNRRDEVPPIEDAIVENNVATDTPTVETEIEVEVEAPVEAPAN